MKKKKSKAKSGTWVTREMVMSEAYWALNSTAKGMLLLFFLKRDFDGNHNCLNCRSLTLTYKELEALHGTNPDGTAKGIARTSISRAIADLMEKGFIDIVRQGGAYQQDKTIYALVEDWRLWVPGRVVKKKTPGKQAGYFALKKNPTTTSLPIHTTELIPKTGVFE